MGCGSGACFWFRVGSPQTVSLKQVDAVSRKGAKEEQNQEQGWQPGPHSPGC